MQVGRAGEKNPVQSGKTIKVSAVLHSHSGSIHTKRVIIKTIAAGNGTVLKQCRVLACVCCQSFLTSVCSYARAAWSREDAACRVLSPIFTPSVEWGVLESHWVPWGRRGKSKCSQQKGPLRLKGSMAGAKESKVPVCKQGIHESKFYTSRCIMQKEYSLLHYWSMWLLIGWKTQCWKS